SFSKATPQPITPYELFYGIKPDLSHLRTFGCQVFVYNPNPIRAKLDDRAVEGRFVGYGEQTNSYLLWIPSLQRIIPARDITFVESTASTNSNNTPSSTDELLLLPSLDISSQFPIIDDVLSDETTLTPTSPTTPLLHDSVPSVMDVVLPTTSILP